MKTENEKSEETAKEEKDLFRVLRFTASLRCPLKHLLWPTLGRGVAVAALRGQNGAACRAARHHMGRGGALQRNLSGESAFLGVIAEDRWGILLTRLALVWLENDARNGKKLMCQPGRYIT